jgi:hypothetical protein
MQARLIKIELSKLSCLVSVNKKIYDKVLVKTDKYDGLALTVFKNLYDNKPFYGMDEY